MSEAEQQIIRLLTEIRDMQKEEADYRRRVLEESLALQKEGVTMGQSALRSQRVALGVIVVALAVVIGLVSLIKLVTDR